MRTLIINIKYKHITSTIISNLIKQVIIKSSHHSLIITTNTRQENNINITTIQSIITEVHNSIIKFNNHIFTFFNEIFTIHYKSIKPHYFANFCNNLSTSPSYAMTLPIARSSPSTSILLNFKSSPSR